MQNDFKLIVHKFDKDITIYPISDVHLGSLEHNKEEWEKFVEVLQSEPNSYVILGGDLLNNATKSSVSNVYEDIIRPMEQKELMTKYLEPIKHKILCAVSGNHERRSKKEVDSDPIYDIMCKLDLEYLYRENVAFMKIMIGTDAEIKKRRNPTYTFAVTHGTGGGAAGTSMNRNEHFGYAIDNLDCLIVGHTHKGAITKPAKINIDTRNNVVTLKPFTVITSQSWLSYGGYAMHKMLLPAANATVNEGQKIVLSRGKKQLNVLW